MAWRITQCFKKQHNLAPQLPAQKWNAHGHGIEKLAPAAVAEGAFLSVLYNREAAAAARAGVKVGRAAPAGLGPGSGSHAQAWLPPHAGLLPSCGCLRQPPIGSTLAPQRLLRIKPASYEEALEAAQAGWGLEVSEHAATACCAGPPCCCCPAACACPEREFRCGRAPVTRDTAAPVCTLHTARQQFNFS